MPYTGVGGFGTPYEVIQTKTADYTVVPGDDLISVAPTAATTITLYTPIGNFPGGSNNVGRVRVMKTNANQYPVTVATAAGSIIGQTRIQQQYQCVEYVSDGVGNWYAFSPIQNSYEVAVALSSADILGMNASPVTLIPAQGAGTIILVESILLKMVTTSTQYANGGAVEFRYTNGSGAKVSADIAAAVITATAGTSYTSVAGVTTSLTPVANSPLVITNATAAFITGTGTGTLYIRFRVVNVA